MQLRPALWLVILLAACGENAAPPIAAPAPVTKTTSPPKDRLATEPLEGPETATPGVAVDEPLPPFEDDSGITIYSQSAFRMSDSALPVSGAVSIYEAPDGSHLLRLENISAPKDLRIDVALQGQTLLVVGPLKGPSGNMNYLLDSGLDLAGMTAVTLVENGSAQAIASAPISRP